MSLINQPVDNDMLILGASSLPEEDYLNLASDLGDMLAPLYTLVWSRALNPADTSKFVKSIADKPNKDELIYERAIKCINDARLVVVDISAASTGMGLEVGYLISKIKEQNKYVVFIAKEGSKISPHITGLYKHVMGESCEVCFYKEPKDMLNAVRSSKAFGRYGDQINIERAY